jgi:soluble lytic murein transglycosylase-like protein
LKTTIACLLLIYSLPGWSYCFTEAAARYRISPDLLQAIARVESNMNAEAIRNNQNGTKDYGLMQINTVWLNQLSGHGVSQVHLMDPCMNIMVGAWILSGLVAKHGLSWQTVGRYHSSTIGRRDEYARKVYEQMIRQVNRG